MPIIDADTHVDETEATWQYLREFEHEFKPITQHPARVDPSKNPVRSWQSACATWTRWEPKYKSFIRRYF